MISELVDLTEHRDFGGRIRSTNLRLESEMSFWDSIHKRINYELYGKIIWRIDLKDEYIPFDGIFPLGTKKQRKEIKESAYWGTLESEVCDCCGKFLGRRIGEFVIYVINKLKRKLIFRGCKRKNFSFFFSI